MYEVEDSIALTLFFACQAWIFYTMCENNGNSDNNDDDNNCQNAFKILVKRIEFIFERRFNLFCSTDCL